MLYDTESCRQAQPLTLLDGCMPRPTGTGTTKYSRAKGAAMHAEEFMQLLIHGQVGYYGPLSSGARHRFDPKCAAGQIEGFSNAMRSGPQHVSKTTGPSSSHDVLPWWAALSPSTSQRSSRCGPRLARDSRALSAQGSGWPGTWSTARNKILFRTCALVQAVSRPHL